LFYLLISLLVLAVSSLLFKKAAGTLSLRKINMISFIFFYHIVIQSLIGATLGILYLDNHYLISRLQDFNLRLTVWLVVLYVMITLPLGMLFVNKIFGVQSEKLFHYYLNKPLQPVLSKKDSYVLFVFYGIALISIGAVIYTYVHLDRIPLIALFSGADSIELAKLRIDASRNFQGNVYIRNILGLGISPVLAYVAYAYYQLYRDSRSMVTFIVLFFNALLILSYNLAKYPVIIFLIGFIFIEVLVKGKINIKKIFSYGFWVVVIVLFMYLNIMGASVSTLLNYNTGPLGRLILTQIAPLYYHFYCFPSYSDFLWGKSFPQFILNIFGVEHIRSARIVMEYINPDGIASGTAGVANTLFVGEAYANFALYGLLLSPFIVGFIIQLSFIILQKMPKNPIFIGFFGYMSYSWPVTGGFIDFLYNPRLVIIVLVLIGIVLVSACLRQYYTGYLRERMINCENDIPSTVRSRT